MNKEYILKKFIKLMNERARKHSFSCSINQVKFIKVSLNCIIVILDSNSYSSNYKEYYKIDLKNKKVENCTVCYGSYKNNENRIYDFRIIGFKKEDYFVVLKDDDYYVIKDKLQVELLTNKGINVKYNEDTEYLYIEYNSNSLESVIDLKEKCYIKYTSDNNYILSGSKVYNLKKEEVFNLDISNKKVIYKGIEIPTKDFKINKNEYFIYDFSCHKNDEFEIINVSIRTKKNSERNICFKLIDNKIEIRNDLIEIRDQLVSFDNKIFRSILDKFYIYHEEKEVLEENLFELDNLNLNTKKGIESLMILITDKSSWFNRYYYYSNMINKLKTNNLIDKIYIRKMSNNKDYFVFSEVFEQCFIYSPSKENKFFHFNSKKIANAICKNLVLFNSSHNEADLARFLKKRINTIHDITFLNKFLCITIEDNYVFESRGWRSYEKHTVKKSNYYFDLKSNFIDYNIINGDPKSIFYNNRITCKLLNKKDRSAFKVNNFKLTLESHGKFNDYKIKRESGY